MSEETAVTAPEVPKIDPVDTSAENSDPFHNLNGSEGAYVRLRGLPFSAKTEDIHSFFQDIPVDEIKMTNTRDGRPSGECYCKLRSAEDAQRAVAELDKKSMNSRYIEVFSVSDSEVQGLKGPGSVVAELEDRVIRMRGLPYSATQGEIENFLTGLTCDEVVIGQTGGRPSGEAYVRLATKEQAAQALELNRKMMGSRYIEIFRTNENDLERHRDRPRAGGYNGRDHGSGRPPSLLSLDYSNRDSGYARRDYNYGDSYGGPVYATRGRGAARPSPYDNPRRPGGGGHGRYAAPAYGDSGETDDAFRNPNNVFMRGIPFDVSVAEIERFFTPLPCYDIRIGYNRENRPSGDAVVAFSQGDVHAALDRNRQYMGRRYVELFTSRDAPPPMRSLVWKRIGGAAAPTAYDYGARAVPYEYGDSRSAYQQNPGYASSGYQGYQASVAAPPSAASDPYGRPQAAYGDSVYGNSYAGYDAYYSQQTAGIWRDSDQSRISYSPKQSHRNDYSRPGYAERLTSGSGSSSAHSSWPQAGAAPPPPPPPSQRYPSAAGPAYPHY